MVDSGLDEETGLHVRADQRTRLAVPARRRWRHGNSCPPTRRVSNNTKGGAFSPFHVHIGRPDGQQELKLVNVTLPKGLTGKLAGIPYCSEAQINNAVHNTGKEEIASPSCGRSQ